MIMILQKTCSSLNLYIVSINIIQRLPVYKLMMKGEISLVLLSEEIQGHRILDRWVPLTFFLICHYNSLMAKVGIVFKDRG